MAEGIGSTYGSMIDACSAAQGTVTQKMNFMKGAEDPKDILKYSLEMMEAQQKMTTLTEGFTKAMKANTDGVKSGINSMT